MLSAIICSLFNNPNKRELIQSCVNSLVGYDELIVFANYPGGMGYCGAWNTAASLAKGDYLVFISDDHRLLSGSLKDMCIEGTVTSPSGENVGEAPFWGGMFCVPRDIYEKHGLYDMEFDEGIHYMDEDLYRRYMANDVPLKRVKVVVEHKDPGHTLTHLDKFTLRVQNNLDIFNRKWHSSQTK